MRGMLFGRASPVNWAAALRGITGLPWVMRLHYPNEKRLRDLPPVGAAAFAGNKLNATRTKIFGAGQISDARIKLLAMNPTKPRPASPKSYGFACKTSFWTPGWLFWRLWVR